MCSISAILIDLDGTLVISRPHWTESEWELLSSRHIEPDQAFQLSLEGLALDEIVEKMLWRYKITEPIRAVSKELESHLLKRLPSCRSSLGASRFVRSLVDRGLKRAVVSNSSHRMIDAALQRKRWSVYIQDRFSADDVRSGKPAPDLYMFAASALGVQPKDCIVVEDTLRGAAAAVAAGMTCLAVSQASSGDAQPLQRLTPHILPNLDAVIAKIGTLHRMR